MATVGFAASEKEKKHIDELAESFVKEHGGNKAGFLAAMVVAYESSNARQELSGRADEIDHVENLLDGLRIAYMSSLAMAKAAKSEASETISSEIAKCTAMQNILQSKIDQLVEENKDLSVHAKRADELQKQYDIINQQLADERGTVNILRVNIHDLTEKIKSMESIIANTYQLSERIKQLEQALDVANKEKESIKTNYDKMCKDYEYRASLSAEKAKNEQIAAVLAVKQEYATKLDEMQVAYNQRILKFLEQQENIQNQ